MQTTQAGEVFARVALLMESFQFTISGMDLQRPWGGFFVIDEQQAAKFAAQFFPEESLDELIKGGRISPKILIVAPHKRLSWQYHRRRAEIWRCIEGPVAVASGDQDHPEKEDVLGAGDIIRLACEKRHRLIGLDQWGVVAEIWQHIHPDHPSDEDDIIRLQDDFGR